MPEVVSSDFVLRAYRFALDPTSDQLSSLEQHAGTARWAFNHALAVKMEAHKQWRAEVDARVSTGVDEKTARTQVKVPIPNSFAMKSAWIKIRGDETKGLDGVSPWWRSVSSYAFSSAFADADTAFKNWMDSYSGKRKGIKVGYPRFKKKHSCRDSFRIYHDVKKPTIRLESYRRLLVPRLGSIRMHSTGKRMSRALDRGGVVRSVAISRGGHRWYAAVLVKEPVVAVVRTSTRRQKAAGAVGVDLGVTHLAALSTGELIANPRHLRKAHKSLRRAQQALSRTEKGSVRRRRAARKVGRLHHRVSERRAGTLHQITKRLTTQFERVALEDLNVSGMTRSAKGTVEAPGRQVKQKSGLNRSILDVAPGEIRRQVDYKTFWYGSSLTVVDRWYPSSKRCSRCGHVKAKLGLSERLFKCDQCGWEINRDINAAINIAAWSPDRAVASETGETKNARGRKLIPSG